MEKTIHLKLTRRLHDHLPWEIIELDEKIYRQEFMRYGELVKKKEAKQFAEDTDSLSFIDKVNKWELSEVKTNEIKEVKTDEIKDEIKTDEIKDIKVGGIQGLLKKNKRKNKK